MQRKAVGIHLEKERRREERQRSSERQRLEKLLLRGTHSAENTMVFRM